MYRRDLTRLGTEDRVYNIGWLSPWMPFFRRGRTPAEFQERLSAFCSSPPARYVTRGMHTCGFCGRVNGGNEIRVAGRDRVYAAPVLVHHYVTAHRYRPPAEFVPEPPAGRCARAGGPHPQVAAASRRDGRGSGRGSPAALLEASVNAVRRRRRPGAREARLWNERAPRVYAVQRQVGELASAMRCLVDAANEEQLLSPALEQVYGDRLRSHEWSLYDH